MPKLAFTLHTAMFFAATFLSAFLFLTSGLTAFDNSKHSRAIFEYLNRGSLIASEFNKNRLKAFETNKTKVVLIGDSYAKDVFNSVRNSELSSDFEISTFSINKECGNLSIPPESFIDNVPKTRWLRCKIIGWYQNNNLTNILEQSDEIWLASSWYPWVIERLNESTLNLSTKYNKPITVFGIKSFGFTSFEVKLKDIKNKNFQASAFPTAQDVKLNALMKTQLKGVRFIDLLGLFCSPPKNVCNHFHQTELISHDGSHLTVAGSKFLGSKMAKLLRAKRNDS